MDIAEWRKKIDEIDRKIVALPGKRTDFNRQQDRYLIWKCPDIIRGSRYAGDASHASQAKNRITLDA